MAHKVYNDQTRQQALALAEMVGASEAARQLDINPMTIRHWQHQEDRVDLLPEEVVRYRQKLREQISEEFGQALFRVVAKIMEKIDSGTAALKDMNQTLALLCDKMLLLSGQPTSHHRRDEFEGLSEDQIRARLEQYLRESQQRRSASHGASPPGTPGETAPTGGRGDDGPVPPPPFLLREGSVEGAEAGG